MTTPTRNYWPLIPVVGLSAVVIASTCMFIAAHRVGPSAVTNQPYLESLRQDERNAERQAFTAAGWQLDARDLGGRQIAFTLTCPPTSPSAATAELILYRPSDPALDRQLPWSRPGEPLTITLPRHGRWRVTVRITGADAVVRSTTTQLDVGG